MEKECFINKYLTLEADADFLQTQEILSRMKGWFSMASHAFFSIFLCYQNKNSVNGNLGEIGVWEGKSASVICKYSRAKEKVFLIDPLIKSRNEVILKNIDDVGKSIPGNLSMLDIVSDNFLNKKDYLSLKNTFRFFHIDGCHTGANVYKDLELVDFLLSTEGIVVVDDYFNVGYPQITEALYKYLFFNPYKFRLFCAGFNKAYLCRPEKYGMYYSYCIQNLHKEFFRRRMAVVIKKTSGIGDCFSISVEGYDKNIEPLSGYRGPDWIPELMEAIELKQF